MFACALRWLFLFLVAGETVLGIASQASAIAEDSPPPKQQSVRSPDETIEVVVRVDGQLTYSVAVDGQPIINPSKLGLKLRDGTVFGRNVELVSATNQSCDSTWENPFGERHIVRDNHNQLCLLLREKSAEGRTFEIVFRAFNDGVAFRYKLLSQPGSREFILDEELSEFVFPGDCTCHAGDQDDEVAEPQQWKMARRLLSDIKPESIVGLPLLVETPIAWVAITEADLLDWAGLRLAGASVSNDGASQPASNNEGTEPRADSPIELSPAPAAVALIAKLAPRADGDGLVKASTPHRSPWRVLMIARQPVQIIESELINNLSTPNQLEDASWIKPGMVPYDQGRRSDTLPTTDAIKEQIQDAAGMGWPYQLIGRNWYGELNQADADVTRAIDALDMVAVLRFAQENGVWLWLRLNWQDLARDDVYKLAFPLYKEWGIAGVQIGGMDSGDQETVKWREKILRAAAENELMVSFHGAFRETGLDRTFPNQYPAASPILGLFREASPLVNQ